MTGVSDRHFLVYVAEMVFACQERVPQINLEMSERTKRTGKYFKNNILTKSQKT